MDKATLRKEYLALRDEIPFADRSSFSDMISWSIIKSEWFQNAQTILCYSAIGSEIIVDLVAFVAIRQGKTVCYPRCLDKNGHMRFYAMRSFVEFEFGMYGILEPNRNCPEVIYFTADTLCLIPGLAFDLNGYRLGYGKGYYDRFLQDFSGIRIGVCAECCRAEEKRWEYDRYDIAADALVTEKGIYRID